jgi:hypothetical protein
VEAVLHDTFYRPGRWEAGSPREDQPMTSAV